MRVLTFTAVLIGLIASGAGSFFVYRHAKRMRGESLEKDVQAYRQTGLPWEAKDVVLHPPAENENAASPIRQAISKFDGNRFWREENSLRLLSQQGPRNKFIAEVRPYEKGLAIAAKAAQLPRLDFHRDWDWDELNGKSFEEGAFVYRFALAFCFLAQSEASSGNESTAFTDLHTAAHLSMLIGQEPLLDGMLMQSRGYTAIFRTIENIAYKCKTQPASLVKLKSIVDSLTAPELPRALRGEAYQGIAVFRSYSASQVAQLSRDQASSKVALPSGPIRTGLPTGQLERAMAARHLQIWTEIGTVLQKSHDDPAQVDAVLGRIDHELESHKSRANLLDVILLPGPGIGRIVLTDEARKRTLSALLEAMRVRARTGKFPASLDKLPGKWTDPFNGQPLKYHLTPSGLRIYSVGPDLKDDGGLDQMEIKFGSNIYDIVASFPPVKRKP